MVKTFGQTVHTFTRFKGAIDRYYTFCVAYCRKCRLPMLLFTTIVNSAFAFLIALALSLAGGAPVAQSVLMNFLFYVIFTPVITTALTKVMYMSENGMIVDDALTRIHSVLDLRPLPRAGARAETAGQFGVVRARVLPLCGRERGRGARRDLSHPGGRDRRVRRAVGRRQDDGGGARVPLLGRQRGRGEDRRDGRPGRR